MFLLPYLGAWTVLGVLGHCLDNAWKGLGQHISGYKAAYGKRFSTPGAQNVYKLTAENA